MVSEASLTKLNFQDLLKNIPSIEESTNMSLSWSFFGSKNLENPLVAKSLKVHQCSVLVPFLFGALLTPCVMAWYQPHQDRRRGHLDHSLDVRGEGQGAVDH